MQKMIDSGSQYNQNQALSQDEILAMKQHTQNLEQELKISKLENQNNTLKEQLRENKENYEKVSLITLLGN